MDAPALERLLGRRGRAAPARVDDAVRQLRRLPFADLGFARVDHHRPAPPGPARGRLRPRQDARAVRRASWSSSSAARADRCCLTRADPAQVEAAVGGRRPRASASTDGHRPGALRHGRLAARAARTGPGRWSSPPGRPTFRWPTSAGRSSRRWGSRPSLLVDCGVAGVHRLLASLDELAEADAVVVVAGMEGALASVVGGVTVGAGGRRADQRRLRRGASGASPRCSPCSRRARRG